MKILHVIPSVSLVHGGPSRAIIDIERSLAARGVEVTTVTTNDDGDTRTLSVLSGQPVVTPYATRWYFPRTTVSFKISVGLGQWLRKNVKEFDVVHTHALFSFAPVAAAYIARRAGVPYVLRPLGVLANYGMTQRRPLLKQASLALVERRLIVSASAIHFTSLTEMADAEALGLECKGVVIPLGIDLSNPTKHRYIHNDDGAFNLLFLSRIDRKKNLEGLMKALNLILPKYPRLKINIAGDGDPRYILMLHTLANQLGIEGHINWLGHLQGKAKREALEGASAFVLPSYSENFGISVVEALAAGLPCVVSREVAISDEIARVGAGIVTGTTPEEIATGIERLLNSESEMVAYSHAARLLACDRFSIDVMGERLEALYRGILDSTPSRRAARAS